MKAIIYRSSDISNSRNVPPVPEAKLIEVNASNSISVKLWIVEIESLESLLLLLAEQQYPFIIQTMSPTRKNADFTIEIYDCAREKNGYKSDGVRFFNRCSNTLLNKLESAEAARHIYLGDYEENDN